MSGLVGEVGAVVRGRRGRLFLGRQDGFDLGRFTDGSALPPSLLKQWRATLLRRGAELSTRGIPYVFMIAPDASSVHPEDLPEQYPGPYHSPGCVFLDAMGQIPGVHFVYPVERLRQAQGGLDVFQRTDSHWTAFGAGVAYRELMTVMSSLVPCKTLPASATTFTFRSSFGDLGSRCEPEVRSDIPIAAFEGVEPVRVADGSGALRQTATATHMPGLPAARVLAFRDSFMTDLSPYLARTFADLLMVGTTTRVMLDAVDEWRADAVISEVAERRLVAFESDHQPHRYDWLYLTNHTGPVGSLVLRALTTMQSDPNSAAEMIRGLSSEAFATPAYAYSAAIILEASGDYKAAIPFAEAALAAQADNTAALALRGRLFLAEGGADKAAVLLQRAVDMAPWNGILSELLAFALIQAGRPLEALEAAEAGIARVQDHANLWYWTGILREASGDGKGAADAVSSALALDPDNRAYSELALRVAPVH